MIEQLTAIAHHSDIAIVSAFFLGLLTAISPCPLATNITATAYIAKNISNKKQVFLSGLVYTLGRAVSYTTIGIILFFGASKFNVAKIFSQNGEKVLGPLLIIIGLIMLNVIRFNFLSGSNFQEKFTEKFKDKGLLGSFLLGALFALAFCPYSGALYFGVLIPITISDSSGLYLPLVFAFGTGLPVIFFTYIIAFAIGKLSHIFNRVQSFERIMRYGVGIVFLLTGLYYIALFLNLI